MNECKTINPVDLANLQAEGGVMNLFDVRSVEEYLKEHAAQAQNMPADRLSAKNLKDEYGLNIEDPIYLICRTGKRSQGVCKKVASFGYQHVFNVEGGTDEWVKVGLPVKNGK